MECGPSKTELIGCLSLSCNQVTAVALWKEIQQLFTETLFSTNLMMKFSRRPYYHTLTILMKSKCANKQKKKNSFNTNYIDTDNFDIYNFDTYNFETDTFFCSVTRS